MTGNALRFTAVIVWGQDWGGDAYRNTGRKRSKSVNRDLRKKLHSLVGTALVIST